MDNFSPFKSKQLKMVKYPDKNKIIELLSKIHCDDVPNWTTNDEISVLSELRSLSLYFFRTEDVLK